MFLVGTRRTGTRVLCILVCLAWDVSLGYEDLSWLMKRKSVSYFLEEEKMAR